MTAEGVYTFKVRALAKNRSKNYRDGYWSEESDTCYISEDYAELLKNGGEIDTDHSGPGVSGDSSAAVSYTHLDVYKRQTPSLFSLLASCSELSMVPCTARAIT